MPKYTYTGAHPRILLGLTEGVNAYTQPRGEELPPVGPGTVVIYPGDVLTTDEPFPHPELLEGTDENPPADPPAEEAPARKRAAKNTDTPEGTAK